MISKVHAQCEQGLMWECSNAILPHMPYKAVLQGWRGQVTKLPCFAVCLFVYIKNKYSKFKTDTRLNSAGCVSISRRTFPTADISDH